MGKSSKAKEPVLPEVIFKERREFDTKLIKVLLSALCVGGTLLLGGLKIAWDMRDMVSRIAVNQKIFTKALEKLEGHTYEPCHSVACEKIYNIEKNVKELRDMLLIKKTKGQAVKRNNFEG